jgi:hypothetical protein
VSPFLSGYVQRPSQGLQSLLKFSSGATLVIGIHCFQAEFKKNETAFYLRKRSALWSDTAQYFCAVSDIGPGAAEELSSNPETGDCV